MEGVFSEALVHSHPGPQPCISPSASLTMLTMNLSVLCPPSPLPLGAQELGGRRSEVALVRYSSIMLKSLRERQVSLRQGIPRPARIGKGWAGRPTGATALHGGRPASGSFGLPFFTMLFQCGVLSSLALPRLQSPWAPQLLVLFHFGSSVPSQKSPLSSRPESHPKTSLGSPGFQVMTSQVLKFQGETRCIASISGRQKMQCSL